MRSINWLGIIAALGFAVVGTSAAAASACFQQQQDDRTLSRDGVSVIGAVEAPGGFSLGEIRRVSDVVEAAGGLRQDAYPLGAILLRRLPGNRPRRVELPAEDELVLNALDELQVLLAGSGDSPGHSALIEAVQGRTRFMRLPVAVDAALQRRFPERNPELAPGDVLLVPAQRSAVTVVGAVESPGVFAFSSGSVADDYIDEAGGWASGAHKARSAVYLPDGRLRTLSQSFWNYKPTAVPPGSIIVVPHRDRRLTDYAGGALGRHVKDDWLEAAQAVASEAAENRRRANTRPGTERSRSGGSGFCR